MFLSRRDGRENVLRGLFSKTRQRSDAPILAGCLEVSHGNDTKLFPDRFDLLWTKALQLEHLENPGRKFGPEVLVIIELTCRHQEPDLLGDGFADAGNFIKLLFGDGL